MRTVVRAEGQTKPDVEAAIAALLNGFVFDRVEYLVPANMVGFELERGQGYEHAEGGVRLVGVDGEDRIIRWFHAGNEEDLWIGLEPDPSAELCWVPEVVSVEADSWGLTSGGETVVRSSVAWQEPCPGASTVWSVRLDLTGGSVVVCLGEQDYNSKKPIYMPDCVIVIFDEQVALEYHPHHTLHSAWTVET